MWYNIAVTNATEPTILVKKADGTFVRMPLSEIKKVPTTAFAFASVASAASVVSTKESALPKPEMPVVAIMPVQQVAPVLSGTKTPESILKPDPLITKQTPKENITERPKLTKTDVKSLLEEDSPGVKPVASGPNRESQAEKVMRKLSFTIPTDLQNRLRSVILLRLKEVRGTDETRSTLLRPVTSGGLGLTELNADELEKLCVEVGNLVYSKKRKNNLPVLEANIVPGIYIQPSVPANTTPFNSFVHGELHGSADKIEKKMNTATKSEEKFTISPTMTARPSVLDIKPSFHEPVTMDLIQEIRYFNLRDFRRLSQDSDEAANRFKQKFLNLKEESILQLWKAFDAWRESPLYQLYAKSLKKSLIDKQSISSIPGSGIEMNGSEIKSIIRIEKELGFN